SILSLAGDQRAEIHRNRENGIPVPGSTAKETWPRIKSDTAGDPFVVMVRAGDERMWGAGPLTLAVALGFACSIFTTRTPGSPNTANPQSPVAFLIHLNTIPCLGHEAISCKPAHNMTCCT